MLKNQKYTNLFMFFAGVLVTLVFMFAFFTNQESRADNRPCIQQALNAKSMKGNIPKPEFLVIYEIPRCYRKYGYVIDSVSIYQNNMVRVKYKK